MVVRGLRAAGGGCRKSRRHHVRDRTARCPRFPASEASGEYDRRDGIEGTISRMVRPLGLRCTRYWGWRKVRLSHALTAAGLNFERVDARFSGTRPAPALESSFEIWIRPTRGSTALFLGRRESRMKIVSLTYDSQPGWSGLVFQISAGIPPTFERTRIDCLFTAWSLGSCHGRRPPV
jgi:hypothetical protein